MNTTLWLIRHGETDWNASRRLQGSTDIALNAVGQAQALNIANHFRAFAFDAIYTSPLARTLQTAAPLAEQKNLAPSQISEIAERDFGLFQGLTPDEIAERYPNDYQRWQAREPDFCPSGGESLLDFRSRVAAGLQSIIDRHAGQVVAVFSHGGVLDIIYRLAKRIDLQTPRDWPIPNAGLQRLLGSKQGLEVLEWGITDHLNGEASRDELRGIS